MKYGYHFCRHENASSHHNVLHWIEVGEIPDCVYNYGFVIPLCASARRREHKWSHFSIPAIDVTMTKVIFFQALGVLSKYLYISPESGSCDNIGRPVLYKSYFLIETDTHEYAGLPTAHRTFDHSNNWGSSCVYQLIIGPDTGWLTPGLSQILYGRRMNRIGVRDVVNCTSWKRVQEDLACTRTTYPEPTRCCVGWIGKGFAEFTHTNTMACIALLCTCITWKDYVGAQIFGRHEWSYNFNL